MLAVTQSGGIIAPPVPAFYILPQTVEDLVDHAVGRVLDLFDIEMEGVQRWGETPVLDDVAELVDLPVYGV